MPKLNKLTRPQETPLTPTSRYNYPYKLHHNSNHRGITKEQVDVTIGELNRQISVAETARILGINPRGTSIYVVMYRVLRKMYLEGALKINENKLAEMITNLKGNEK